MKQVIIIRTDKVTRVAKKRRTKIHKCGHTDTWTDIYRQMHRYNADIQTFAQISNKQILIKENKTLRLKKWKITMLI